MNLIRRVVWFLLAAAIVGGTYWYMIRRPAAVPPKENNPTDGPVVPVRVEPLRRQKIEERLIVYGTVVAAVGKSQQITEPFEVRVRQVFVTAGQPVAAGAKLIEIEPSLDTQLKLNQARTELNAAQEAAQLAQDSFKLKLSTRQDLAAGQKRLQDAQTALQSMLDRGMAEARVITADASGVIMQITGHVGEIVAAGGPLLELARENQIEIRVGIENEDIHNLSLGQKVRIVPVFEGEGRAVDAAIKLITQQVNPQTRLIDVYLTPASTTHLMLNEYVRGEIIVVADQSLVVPRSAVLPAEDHYALFTAEHGHVIEHAVKIGIDNDQQVQILDSDLQPGQLVVVSGNSELKNGMSVEAEPVP